MTISAAAFAVNLAALSITTTKQDATTGALVIMTLANKPRNVTLRDLDLLYPQPEYQTDLDYERKSVGSDPYMEVTWTANYFYLFSELGRNRWAEEKDAVIAANVNAIYEAVSGSVTALGVTEALPGTASNAGTISMPNGATFRGALVAFSIRDYRSP